MPPNELEQLEQWCARNEVRINDAMKALADHERLPGHSPHQDLLNRISRLELGIATSLVGIVLLLIKEFAIK